MADFGIKVTKKGANYSDAQLKDQLLNTKYPFAKIDMTNDNGFQQFRVVFNNDAPYNGDGSERTTTIYQFKHNAVDPKTKQKLTPSFWTVVRNSNTSAGAQSYFQGSGQIAATTAFSYAGFSVWADQDYIYFDVVKAKDPSDPNPNLVGTILNIRTYVFVEDLRF